MKRTTLIIAWSLLGILTVAGVLISLGKRENAANPSADSYGPSGLSAFAALLRENGYQISTTSSPSPRLQDNEVAIVAVDEQEHDKVDEESPGIFGVLGSFTKRGGKVVVLPYLKDFAGSSSTVMAIEVESDITKSQSELQLRPSYEEGISESYLQDGSISASIWHKKDSPYEIASLARYGKGTVLTLADGYMAANRYLDRSHNADVLVSAIATVAPKGSRLVFTEAAFTNESPDLISVLGPGAAGAWYQAIFFFVVVVFTLGRRFGLPEETRSAQTGQRELINAIADSYKRARSTKVACRSAYDRADMEVRKVLKLSADAPTSERDDRVPPGLALEFRRVFEGTIDPLPAQEAFERCRALRRQVKSFLHRS